MVKNPPAILGDMRDAGSVPGWGRSHGEGHVTPLQYILSWRVRWTEEPGGLRP